MNGVASDSLEIQRRNLLSVANAELQRRQQQNQEHLQEYQQDVQRHLSEVQNEVQSQQVARREEVGILHELSQFLIEGHIIRLYTLQADLGRPNVQSRHERDSWTAGCRGLETETIKDVKMQCSRKKEERRNGGGRDGGMKKSRRDMEKETEQEEAKREGKEEPQKVKGANIGLNFWRWCKEGNKHHTTE